jgi:hypothetical protein
MNFFFLYIFTVKMFGAESGAEASQKSIGSATLLQRASLLQTF